MKLLSRVLGGLEYLCITAFFFLMVMEKNWTACAVCWLIFEVRERF